ncbi:MAG: 2'-5' RNA ligase family protein, partial [Rhizobiaceae bacterium]
MPRLFTGLEVPAHIRAILSLKQAGIPKMRWIDPADFHITLRFIGDVSIRQADDIV